MSEDNEFRKDVFKEIWEKAAKDKEYMDELKASDPYTKQEIPESCLYKISKVANMWELAMSGNPYYEYAVLLNTNDFIRFSSCGIEKDASGQEWVMLYGILDKEQGFSFHFPIMMNITQPPMNQEIRYRWWVDNGLPIAKQHIVSILVRIKPVTEENTNGISREEHTATSERRPGIGKRIIRGLWDVMSMFQKPKHW